MTPTPVHHIAALTELPDFRRCAPVDDPDTRRQVAVRFLWSTLVEPGDQVAGHLTGALGAETALALLITAGSADSFARQAAAHARTELTPQRLAAAWQRWQPRLSLDRSRVALATAARNRLRLLTPELPDWPAQLDRLDAAAPHTLWLRGAPAALTRPSLAIVGARAASRYGQEVTADMTRAVSAAGGTVVSGAAYGIDAVAHRVALDYPAGTVAVLAGGCDRAYPLGHTALLDRIAESGAVISEVPPGTAPTRWRFLQRNRLIAALANATLVTEAGRRSGAINTAGHAAQLGTPLGAVPGSISSPGSAGCHLLIREFAAELICSPQHARELAQLPDPAELDLFDGDETCNPSQPAATGAAATATGTDATDPAAAPGAADADAAATEATNRATISLAGAGPGDCPTAQPPTRSRSAHVRVIDSLPLRGARSRDDIAIRSGLSPVEVTCALAELELLGTVRRITDAKGERWRLTA